MIASIVGTLAVIALVVFFIVDTGSDHTPAADKTTSSAPRTPTASPSSPASSASRVPTYPCAWTKSGAGSRPVQVPKTTAPPKTGTVTVAVKTTQGPFTIKLN